MQNISKQQQLNTNPEVNIPPRSTINPPFYLAGTVVRGDGRGSEIGFPTINVEVTKIIIPHGVYVVLARFKEQVLKGIAHIGALKTFNINEPRCEVYLFNFQGNLYHKRVEINLLHLLRDIKKFEDKDALVNQIQKDIIVAQNFLKNI